MRDEPTTAHTRTIRDVVLMFHVAAIRAGFDFRTVTEWKPFKDTPTIEQQLSPTERIRPDGVMCISSKNAGTLLFLEVDRGHQTLQKSTVTQRSLREKLALYCRLFDSNQWKRWERYLDRAFSGFRVLYVTDTTDRAIEIARVVRELPDCGFVWVTDKDAMNGDLLHAPVCLVSDGEQRAALLQKTLPTESSS